MIKFIFNPADDSYGMHSNGEIAIILPVHKTLIHQIMDTIIHESLHAAIDECYIDVWERYTDGEEDVVKQLTEWSLA